MARQQRRPAAAPTPPPPAARASLLLRLHRPASHRPGRKMGGRGVRQGSQASAGERGRQGPVQRRGSSRGQGSSSPHSAACMVWYGAGVVAPAATPQPHCIPALYLVQVCRGNEFTPRVGVAPPCKAPPPPHLQAVQLHLFGRWSRSRLLPLGIVIVTAAAAARHHVYQGSGEDRGGGHGLPNPQ